MGKVGPGSFQIVNVDGSQGGAGQGILADWIANGCSCETSTPTWLYGDPGAKFNAAAVKAAMDTRVGTTLLFPVYDTTSGSGSNFQYHVIGFAGFNISSYSFKGNGGTISGSFVKVDWAGSGSNSADNYFGATTTQLVG